MTILIEKLGGRRLGDPRYCLMIDGAECERLLSAARELRDERDACADRLEHEQRDHEVTKGYRQHAESQVAELKTDLSTLREREQLEKAVVEALVAERAARDAIPSYKPVEGEFPPRAFWDGARLLEAEHAKTEKALDALLARRQRSDNGNR